MEYRVFQDKEFSIRKVEDDRIYQKIILAPTFEELRSIVNKMVGAFGKPIIEKEIR